MIYYVAANAPRNGCGTKEKPFQTISEAAAAARAGDEVLVAPGIYREYVNPKNGGTDENNRIVYRSEEPLAAVITGAEPIKLDTVSGQCLDSPYSQRYLRLL